MGTTAVVYEFGPFRLDAAKGVLWRDGQVVRLPPKVLQVLAALVERSGDVVLRDDLMDRVWPSTAVEETNLTVNISSLRKALGKREDGRPYIETVPRRGYRLLAAPLRVASGAPGSLAVLPFRGLGAGTGDDGLGAAMADALITRLGSTGRVAVRPTSAVLRYSGRDVDARVVGGELKVDTVLEGTFQRVGRRLRVTAQLVPTRDSGPRWTGTFEEDYTNLFAVQDAVAEQLARALALELSDSEREALARHPTEHVEAYEAYVRGRHFWNRFTGPSLQKAFACFQEALAKDPGYARAHVGLAAGHIVLAISGLLPLREAWGLAERSARRALDLDPALSEAHVTLAYVLLFRDWDMGGAERELETAVRLRPVSAVAHQYYALVLALEGRFEEMEAHLARAVSLDPVSIVAHSLRALRWLLVGEVARAEAEFRNVIELEPSHFIGHWGVSAARAASGHGAEAVTLLRPALELSPASLVLQCAHAWALASANRIPEARAVLAALEEASERGLAASYHAALIHARLGDAALAIDRLARAAESHDPWIVLIGVDPRLRRLRSDPRFVSILGRVVSRPTVVAPRRWTPS